VLDVVTETVIHRPRDVVAAYAADPANATRWYSNIKSVEWLTAPPLRGGTRLAFVAQFLGRRLVYTYEVVDFAPRARLVMRTAEGPFPMETEYTWTSIGGDATRMTLRNRGNPTGFSQLFVPFMTLAVRSANRKDLARLKQLLESGAAPATRS
jgi:hypothetical protein